MTTLGSLGSLASLISESVCAIEQICSTSKTTIPDLDGPFSLDSEAPLLDAQISALAKTIVSAAAQLTAILTPAPLGLITTSMQFHVPAALRIVVETNVVEILREGGPNGLHINEISSRNGVDASKLGRILRLLATEHIFREISPDVFTNNRISSVLDTGKDVDALIARPTDKFLETSGIAAAVSHLADEEYKSSGYLLEALTDRDLGSETANDHTHTAFSKAFNTDLSMFTWMETPGNEYRLRRFGIGFQAGSLMFPQKAICEGYNWTKLPSKSLIVDVGGGVGTQTMILAKEYPNFKYIVQDREAVIDSETKLYFESSAPDLLSSRTVKLQAHDFFTEQPVKHARVYIMRMILHDWPDSVCIQILKHLREAAGSDSELIIIEYLMEYACEDTTVDHDVPGMESKAAPNPLLPNYGHANLFPYFLDLQMMACLNGVERTPSQFKDLLQKAGWKMKEIHRAPIGQHQIVATIA